MSLSELDKQEILEKSKNWFKETIAQNHIKNTIKLEKPSEFNINPFLLGYLSKFLSGDTSAKSLAKALILPRSLGSSITTSFGQNLQNYITEALSALGSLVSGIDIEYVDDEDGRKKYCQLKAGPNTINKDDVTTIDNHFQDAKNLARTNNVGLQMNDLVVGILYGEAEELSSHYKKLKDTYHYEVLVGKELWKHITGDENFYEDLQKAIAEIAEELEGQEELEETITKLSQHPDIIALSRTLNN